MWYEHWVPVADFWVSSRGLAAGNHEQMGMSGLRQVLLLPPVLVARLWSTGQIQGCLVLVYSLRALWDERFLKIYPNESIDLVLQKTLLVGVSLARIALPYMQSRYLLIWWVMYARIDSFLPLCLLPTSIPGEASPSTKHSKCFHSRFWPSLCPDHLYNESNR